MVLYKENNIVKGCIRKDGKLLCYAYDLSTLPPGAEDPKMSKRKCEIIFDGGEPLFRVTAGGESLCVEVLKDLGNIIKKSKEIGLSASDLPKAIKKAEENLSFE